MKTPLIVNELYAANTGTAASRIDLAYNLKRGSIAFYDYIGNLIADSVATPAAISGDVVNAVVGLGEGKVLNINDITRSTFRYNYHAYAAAVLKKMTIGGDGTLYSLNLPSTIPSGAVAIIHVYNTTQLNDTMNYKEYIVPVHVGASALQIVTAMVARINLDVDGIVTASINSTDKGITFVSKGFDFVVTAGGVLADADVLEYKKVNHKYVAYTTAGAVVKYNVGSGLFTQVYDAESYFFATRGNGNYQNDANNELYTEDRLAISTNTYHQYNTTYYLEPYALKKSDDYINELAIYIDSSKSALKTSIDTILAAL